MNAIVIRYVEGLIVGDPTHIDGFTALPLFHNHPYAISYAAFQSAMEEGTLSVREINTTGRVGDMLACNPWDSLTFGLDGEELVGSTQNRILDATVLLEGDTETVIPVSCTEQGLWAYTTIGLAPSISLAPPRIRQMVGDALPRTESGLSGTPGRRMELCGPALQREE